MINILRQNFPKLHEVDDIRLSVFNISTVFQIKDIPKYFISIIKRYGSNCLYFIANYLKNLDEFIEKKELRVKYCKLIYTDYKINKRIDIADMKIRTYHYYKYLDEDLYNIFLQKHALSHILKVELDNLYVIENEIVYKIEDLNENTPDNLFLIYGVKMKSIFEKQNSLIWALSLSGDYRVPYIGDFVQPIAVPHDIHCFMYDLKVNNSHSKAIDINKINAEALYEKILKKSEKVFEEFGISFYRFNNSVCNNDDVNYIVDLRIALELITGMSDKTNKTTNISNYVNNILKKYSKTEVKQVYKFLSSVNHKGHINKGNKEEKIKMANEMLRDIIIKEIEDVSI